MYFSNIFIELLFEADCLIVIKHMLMDAVLDNDQTQKRVVNNRGLHFMQLFRHLLFFVVYSCSVEVLSYQEVQDCVSEELKSLVVVMGLDEIIDRRAIVCLLLFAQMDLWFLRFNIEIIWLFDLLSCDLNRFP